ncbi:cytochrome P450 [Achromobacter sp. ACM04]|uniref:cytochrome P450 n=1 Tax=Achromobacter TaxID=222 RepID=UPI0014673984|nr:MULTISPECIES: cytochrome P450 [Achromobacter]MBD9423032.1 cytochrome P450 [Achromobacter sp. ACM04]MBD9433540.1 cytochrome P450 [Achromobacter sp. ACM03]CAB3818350.1 Cytochrome P450-terp [Achromobacter aegrifaciens]
MSLPDAILPQHIADAIIDPKVHADLERLHAAYAWARANNPLGRAQVEGYDPFWVVTKHADVSLIGRDSQTFHNADLPVVCLPRATIEHMIATTGNRDLTKSLIRLDDPEHKKLRALTQAWFMPNSILKLDERMRALAKATVDKMAVQSGEVVDFARDVAVHYPLHIIMDILGVPSEDEARMLTLTQELFGGDDPELSRNKGSSMDLKAKAEAKKAVIADFRQYFDTLTADRRANPRNDVASLLANAEIDGLPLSDMHRLGYYVIIATAGHDTTSSSTATAMWALTQSPELLARLKADNTLIPAFIEEAVRFASPVRHFMRCATADVEIRGRTIRKGDWVMLCYGSANRDEEIFEDPFSFRIDRKPNRHLAFGIGAHVCLGQHLARMEMRVLFETMIPRLQSVEPAGPLELVASNFVSGPKRLPIRYKLH